MTALNLLKGFKNFEFRLGQLSTRAKDTPLQNNTVQTAANQVLSVSQADFSNLPKKYMAEFCRRIQTVKTYVERIRTKAFKRLIFKSRTENCIDQMLAHLDKNIGSIQNEAADQAPELLEQTASLAPASADSDSPTAKIDQAFNKDFLCRITGLERDLLVDELKKLNERSLSSSEIEAFQKGDWNHAIFRKENWPLLVIHAYIQGKLDEWQVSKLLLFDSSKNLHKFKTHRLLDAKGKVNPKVGGLLVEGLKYLEFTNPKQLEGLPPENLEFFSFRIPCLEGKDYENELERQIVDSYNFMHNQFNSENGSRQLCTIFDPKTKELEVLILPPLLFHSILKLKHGDNAMSPKLVLGYREDENMEDPKKRVMGVPCRFVSDPSTIHDMVSTQYMGLYSHDCYHLAVESANPHREIWIELARKIPIRLPKIKAFIEDRDFQYYPLDNFKTNLPSNLSDAQKFWYTVSNINDEEAKKIIIQTVLDNQLEWGPKFGISIDSLKNCYLKDPSNPYLQDLVNMSDTIR